MRFSFIVAAVPLLVSSVLGAALSPRQGAPIAIATNTTSGMSQPVVQHLVWFELKDGANPQEVLNRLFALKDSVNWNGRKLITDIKGGYQSSTEGYAKGLQVGAVVTFANDADCIYYTYNATAHQNFKQWVKPYVFDGVVIDFTDIANNSTKSS